MGEGRYITTAGTQGTFSSFANVDDSLWTAAYLRDGTLMTYNAHFYFDDTNFYNMAVIQIDNSGNESQHVGHGYCMESTCHLSAFLDHGMLEETIVFKPKNDSIERMASLLYVDENGDIQTIIWQENMKRFNTNYCG